jgi:acid phosphatase
MYRYRHRFVPALAAAITITCIGFTPAAAAPVSVTKVLVFVEENHSLAEMKAGMPYLYSQATTYGYATNYAAIRHPSLPNYLAIAGASTFNVVDDAAPSSHPIVGRSVFGAAITAGRSAKSYQESMTSNCRLTNSGRYAVKHNPWAYFTGERTKCQVNDVPSGTYTSGALHNDIVNGTLPNVGEVTPNLDNDAHDGSLGRADTWLKNWFTLIYASPDWKAGRLAIIVLADEDDSTQGNKVLTTVIHRSQSHRVVATALTHYSLTGLLTQLTHASCINAGCSAAKMATAFALPLG